LKRNRVFSDILSTNTGAMGLSCRNHFLTFGVILFLYISN
jgi:hypothetical protein